MDQEAESFVEGIRPRLVGSLTLYCGDRQTAEDLAQEALVRTWMKWRKVSEMASPEAWTFRTALNLASSWGRRRQAERRATRRLAHQVPTAAGAEPADVLALRDAVAVLPPRQRAAVVCRYYAGLPVADSAEVMGCRPGTVKALTSQGIDSLRASGLIAEVTADA